MIIVMGHADMAAIALDAAESSITMLDPDDYESSMTGAGQALFWLCALDEQMWDVASYKSDRNVDPAGRLFTGLRILRNSIAHGAAVIVQTRTGMTSPERWPEIWRSVDWAPLPELLNALSKQPSAAACASYSEHLEGRSAILTLREAHTWLATRLQASSPVSTVTQSDDQPV